MPKVYKISETIMEIEVIPPKKCGKCDSPRVYTSRFAPVKGFICEECKHFTSSEGDIYFIPYTFSGHHCVIKHNDLKRMLKHKVDSN